MPPSDNFSAFVEELSSSVGNGEVAVFCGAGISMSSGLPLVSDFIRTILGRLQAADEDVRTVLDSPLPFEAFVEILDNCSDISDLLSIFELGSPNPTHLFLAELAKAGHVQLICTTNFDGLLERALEQVGLKRDVDFEVLYRDEQFDRLRSGERRVRLVKVHGSIDDKADMAITMRQVAGHTLTQARRQVIDATFAGEPHRRVLVLGYSCSDLFDLSPHIEAIESGHREVVYVDHDRNSEDVRSLADKGEKNPFRGFAGSKWVLCDTDRLVTRLATLAGIQLPERIELAAAGRQRWERRIESWANAAEAIRPGVAAWGILGEIFWRLSHFERSVWYYGLGLEAARARGDRRHEGACLGNLANGESELGRTQDAMRHYEAAIVIARELNDAKREAMWLCNLGGLHLGCGEPEQAIASLERALQLGRQRHDRATESYAATNLGHALYLASDYERAKARYLEALDVVRELGDKVAELAIAGSLGQIAHHLGDFASAIAFHQQALVLSRQMGDRAGECRLRGHLANDYLAMHDLDSAAGQLEQAIALARATGDRRAEAGRLSDFGNLQRARGDFEAAIETHRISLALAREVGDLAGEGSCYGNLGVAFQSLGRHDAAAEHYQRALEIARRVGNRQLEATWLGNLGATLHEAGDHSRAIDCFVRSIDLAQQVGDRARVANGEYNLGLSRLAMGEVRHAARHVKCALDLYTALYGVDHAHTLRARARLEELSMSEQSALYWIQAANGHLFELWTVDGKRVIPVFTTPEAAQQVRKLVSERFHDPLSICYAVDVARAVFEDSAIPEGAPREDYRFVYEDSDQYEPFLAGLRAYSPSA